SNAALCAPAGHICTALGLRGPTFTLTSGGTSGILALILSAAMIRSGEVQVAVVVACDEVSEPVLAAADDCGFLTNERVRPFDRAARGAALGEAAVAIVLESSSHVRNRPERRYCQVLESG